MYAMGNNHYAALEAARQEFARYPNLQAIVLGCIAGNFRDWTLVKQELIQYVAERGKSLQTACKQPGRTRRLCVITSRNTSLTLKRPWLIPIPALCGSLIHRTA